MVEVAVVGGSVGERVLAFAVFGSIKELPSVLAAIFPRLVALSVGQVIEPLSLVLIALDLIGHFAFALCDVVPDLSLVVTALAEYVPAVSMRKSMAECPIIIAAVFEKQLAHSVRLLVLPLPFVDGS